MWSIHRYVQVGEMRRRACSCEVSHRIQLEVWIRDIALRRSGRLSGFGTVGDDGDNIYLSEEPPVVFSKCKPGIAINQELMAQRFSKRYSTLLHEVGHVLGISGGEEGAGQKVHHPSKEFRNLDTVMGSGGVLCAPTPLDVVAVYALYQTR